MRPDAELRLPVDPAFVSVLRAATVSLAARLDFTLDDIEDLRMAVSEAAGLVLPLADDDTDDLLCEYFFGDGRLTVRVTVRSSGEAAVDRTDFAWQVLSALTVDAASTLEDGHLSVSFTVASTATR